eukprot:jgi/Bigna1/77801/fgenesh1_pg.50_\
MAEDEKEELLYDGCGNSQGSTMEDWSALKGENPLWKNFLRCALVPSTGGAPALDDHTHKISQQNSRIIIRRLMSLLIGAACGMGLGNIGGVVASRGFKDAYRNPSDSMIEALVSAMPLGAICGSVFVGYLMDRFGRRSSSMLVAVLIMISSLLLFIPLWVFLPWWAIFLCRFFVGAARTARLKEILLSIPPLCFSSELLLIEIGTGMGYGTIYTMGAEMAHPSGEKKEPPSPPQRLHATNNDNEGGVNNYDDEVQRANPNPCASVYDRGNIPGISDKSGTRNE